MKLRPAGQARKPPVGRDGHAIGLDLGATAVRATLLALTSKNGRPSVAVRGLGSVPLPPGAVVNGVVTEPAVVTKALKKLWATKGFNGRSIILGIANPQVVVRPLQIPNLSAQQRAQALPFQAREIIALPMDEVILDYVQVGEPDTDTGMVSGLLIAAPRRPVLAAVEAVERAGLTVARVDLSSFGALRAIADEHLAVQAVIDVGAHLTSIVIHNHGVPQLVRTVARGGQELTDILAERCELDQDAAEEMKCERGLIGRSDSTLDALQAGIRPLLAEIRSSINYFRAGSGGAQIEGISLTGGGAALPGLVAAISTQNGLPTALVVPLQHFDSTPAVATPVEPAASGLPSAASAVSVGLAMGGSCMKNPATVADRPALWTSMPGWGIAADLTPPELVNARHLKALRKLMAVGIVLLLLACAGGYYLAAHERSNTEIDLEAAQGQTDQLQRVGRSYASVVAIQGSVTQVQAQVAEVMGADVDLVALLVVLESSLPKSMIISQEAITVSTVSVVGATGLAAGSGLDTSGLPRIGTITIGGTGGALTDLSDYIDRLQRIPGLVDVLPVSNTASTASSRTQFSLTIGLTNVLLSHRFDSGGG